LEKGPDVYVTLTTGPKPVEGASVVIARLTRFSGEQSFELPATVELNQYSHLVLWCRKYTTSPACSNGAIPRRSMPICAPARSAVVRGAEIDPPQAGPQMFTTGMPEGGGTVLGAALTVEPLEATDGPPQGSEFAHLML
jgi:hypothetical protein